MGSDRPKLVMTRLGTPREWKPQPLIDEALSDARITITFI
jgi:hypothetical protein